MRHADIAASFDRLVALFLACRRRPSSSRHNRRAKMTPPLRHFLLQEKATADALSRGSDHRHRHLVHCRLWLPSLHFPPPAARRLLVIASGASCAPTRHAVMREGGLARRRRSSRWSPRPQRHGAAARSLSSQLGRHRAGRPLRTPRFRAETRRPKPNGGQFTTVTARRFWAQALSFDPTTAGRSLP